MYSKLIKTIIHNSLIVATLVASTSYAQQKILVVGDSLSAGYGLDIGTAWVNLLQQKLKQENYSAVVINASISGETTSGGANKIRLNLNTHQPDIVIIELGGNDGLQGLSIQSMQKNLASIIEAARQHKSKIVLIGMKIPPNYGLQYTQQFSHLYQDLATQYQTAYVPFLLAGIGGNPLLMQADGIHANAKAQAMILDHVWPKLKPLLKNH